MKKLFLILLSIICLTFILTIDSNLLALELEVDFNSAKCIAIDKLDTSEFNKSIIDGFNHVIVCPTCYAKGSAVKHTFDLKKPQLGCLSCGYGGVFGVIWY